MFAFAAIVLMVSAHAQPVAVPGAASPAASPEPAGMLVPQAAPTLFNLGPLPITSSTVCTWAVALLIIVFVRATTWKLQEVPTGGQNMMEALMEGWQDLMGNVLEPKVIRWVFPYATTFFIFIVISNLTDLCPFVGSVGYGLPDKTSAMPWAVEHVARPFFRSRRPRTRT